MDDWWLSVQEIARYLGVSRDTLYAWLSKQSMPAHRIGRLWKFKRAEVDAWVHDGGAAVVSSATTSRGPAREDGPGPTREKARRADS